MKARISILFLIAFVTCLSCFYSCSKEGLSPSTATGKGGSLAKFTIAGNYLYIIDGSSLSTYELSKPGEPRRVGSVSVTFDVETVYPFKDYLFLGSRTGFYIYSISTPANPKLVGLASHVRSCDPVVANDSVAFVTLQGSGACGPAVSGLYIHDIKKISSPALIKIVEMPTAYGLGLQDSVLYVCGGSEGLKVFNVKNPASPKLLTTKTDSPAYTDVIPYNGILICYVQNGLALYDISNPVSPLLIKEIN